MGLDLEIVSEGEHPFYVQIARARYGSVLSSFLEKIVIRIRKTHGKITKLDVPEDFEILLQFSCYNLSLKSTYYIRLSANLQ